MLTVLRRSRRLDRAAHCKGDDFVGGRSRVVDATTPILIVSDHGFHSFRQSVNLNTWPSTRASWRSRAQPGEKKLEDLLAAAAPSGRTSTGRTKAYAMGLGQSTSTKGREGRGMSSPATNEEGAERSAARLLTMTDPNNGASSTRSRRTTSTGEFMKTPRAGRDGRRLPRLVAVDARRSPGSSTRTRRNGRAITGRTLQADARLISSVPIAAGSATSIMDIAPTVLKYFGLAIPGDIDGKPLF